VHIAPIPLDDVIANDDLEHRPVRPRDRDAEEAAMQRLREGLVGSPRSLLQKLAEVAVELCGAHSAGISLIEDAGGSPQFRWVAVAGKWRELLWTTLPRNFSPCGTVLDRSAPQLMILPERHFVPLAQLSPRVAEALLVPFAVKGVLVGTVWVIAHDASRQFDREDRRVVSRLSEFAAAAYERLASMSQKDLQELLRMRAGWSPTAAPIEDRD
jgi:GAF domain-containing protein